MPVPTHQSYSTPNPTLNPNPNPNPNPSPSPNSKSIVSRSPLADPSTPTPTPNPVASGSQANLHPSAAAPRQSNAFKRLGNANLVSSSVFKSCTPSSQSPIRPGTRPAPTRPSPGGGQSQMANALRGLGLDHPMPINGKPKPDPVPDCPPTKAGIKRKSDENLPIPARPPPNLPASVPPLQPTHVPPTSPSASKARPPPRQSSAFTSLSTNALVSSSPFKAPHTPATPIPPHPAPDHGPEEDGGVPSPDSDLAPRTPPVPPTPSSPRTGSSNGLLKTHRLGGPRSFTPPHSPPPSRPSQLAPHPPSALTTPGRRHERRKTVTWGGEDVLEFECDDDDWRRTSLASSVDSPGSPCSPDQLHSVPSPEHSSPDPDCFPDGPQPSPSSSDDHPPAHEDQFWGRLPSSSSRAPSQAPNQAFGAVDQPSLDSSDDVDPDASGGSVVVHSSSEDERLLAVPGDLLPDHRNSLSSDTDPVDQMVNALLTSPDLAPHVASALSAQPLAAPPIEHLPASDHPPTSATQDRPSQIMHHQDAPPPKPRSRFPYLKPEPDNDHQLRSDSNGLLAQNTILSDHAPTLPATKELQTERAPFRPISLPGFGAEDSLFGEVSLISSILESSTINVDSLNGIQVPTSAAHQLPVLSSTPRTSYAHQLPPPPDPLSPALLADAGLLPADNTLAPAQASPGSPRRPLPRPPPTSAPTQAVSALNAPPDTLPDLASRSPFPAGASPATPSAAVWRRPTLESIGSESDCGGSDSLVGSPSSTRPRITREKIMERMRERERAARDEPELEHPGGLTREPTWHTASIHRLGLDGEEEVVEPVGASVPLPVARPHAIQARPPLRAQPVSLSDTVLRNGDEPGGSSLEDATVRQEVAGSGLDRLAHGFQSSEDGARSADSSVSEASAANDQPSGTVAEEVLPSKLVRIKGAGRRRRSLSTGGADLEETGTGRGAKAAVRSASIIANRPISMMVASAGTSTGTGTGTSTVDKERAKVVSGLLHNTIQRAIEDTEFQAPLDRALKMISEADRKKSYHVTEAEEVVVASDQHTLTAGVAGDVAVPGGGHHRNWRKLRKVSDLNEHEKQIRAFWEKNEGRDKIGKVFVKMSKLVFRGLPPCQRPVYFQVVIDNGLHTVKTAAYKLEEEVTVGVEFELVRARKLEFSLAFTVPLEDPRNAHLRPTRPPPSPVSVRPVEQLGQQTAVPNSPKFGFAAKLFGGNSKRHSKMMQQQQQQQQEQLDRQRLAAAHLPPPHPLISLLDRNQTLATAVVNFEQHADESLGRWKQVVIPCMSAQAEDPVMASMQMRAPVVQGPVGQVCVEFLSLPPVPKVANAVVPNSSSEILKGLRIAEWWQEVWHEGVLSQMGADCATWRRRTFKATGGSLFAYNDIMNKLSAEIRLAEVVALEDCGGSPGTAGYVLDEGEVLPACTFRLRFKDGSAVLFHADDVGEYKRWKNVLGQLIGKIQQLPAWAELLRLQIAARRKAIEEGQSVEREERGVGPRTSRQPGRRAGATGGLGKGKGKSTAVVGSSKASTVSSEWSEALETVVSVGSSATAASASASARDEVSRTGAWSLASGSGSGSGSGSRTGSASASTSRPGVAYRMGAVSGASGSGSAATSWATGRQTKPIPPGSSSLSTSSAGGSSHLQTQPQQQQSVVRSGMKRSQGKVRLNE